LSFDENYFHGLNLKKDDVDDLHFNKVDSRVGHLIKAIY
jgi:hypothetical protein